MLLSHPRKAGTGDEDESGEGWAVVWFHWTAIPTTQNGLAPVSFAGGTGASRCTQNPLEGECPSSPERSRGCAKNHLPTEARTEAPDQDDLEMRFLFTVEGFLFFWSSRAGSSLNGRPGVMGVGPTGLGSVSQLQRRPLFLPFPGFFTPDSETALKPTQATKHWCWAGLVLVPMHAGCWMLLLLSLLSLPGATLPWILPSPPLHPSSSSSSPSSACTAVPGCAMPVSDNQPTHCWVAQNTTGMVQICSE